MNLFIEIILVSLELGNLLSQNPMESKKFSSVSTTLYIFTRNLNLIWLFPEEAILVPINGVI